MNINRSVSGSSYNPDIKLFNVRLSSFQAVNYFLVIVRDTHTHLDMAIVGDNV